MLVKRQADAELASGVRFEEEGLKLRIKRRLKDWLREKEEEESENG
jgi:hypothetical protein